MTACICILAFIIWSAMLLQHAHILYKRLKFLYLQGRINNTGYSTHWFSDIGFAVNGFSVCIQVFQKYLTNCSNNNSVLNRIIINQEILLNFFYQTGHLMKHPYCLFSPLPCCRIIQSASHDNSSLLPALS